MNKFKKDVFSSLIFSIIKIILSVYFIYICDSTFSVIYLGVFLFGRRIISILSNIFQLGISQSLIRFLSIKQKYKNKHYLICSLCIFLTSSIILLGLSFTFLNQLSNYLFPNLIFNKKYVMIITISIINNILYYIIYSILIFKREIIKLNLIDILFTNVFLFIGIILFKNNILNIFIFHNICSLLIFLFLILIELKLNTLYKQNFSIKKDSVKLIKYGFPRTLITFLDDYFLFLGTLFLKDNPENLSYILIALVLIKIIPIAFQPLVKLSSAISNSLIENKNSIKLNTGISVLFGLILYMSIFISIYGFFWSETVFKMWLTNKDTIINTTKITKILIITTFPFALFHCFKGIIEIKYIKPLNLLNLTISIIIQIVCIFILKNYYSMLDTITLSLSLGISSLGIFTFYAIKENLKIKNYYRFDIILILSLLTIIYIKMFVKIFTIYTLIYSLILLFMALFAIFIKIKTPFLEDLKKILTNRL
jgi:O-antigen/teichoic acid export membrane protein